MPSKGAVFGFQIFGLSLCICVWVLLIPYLIGNDGAEFNPLQNLLDDLFSQKGKEVRDDNNDVLDPILTSLMAISIVYAILFIVSLSMNIIKIYHVFLFCFRLRTFGPFTTT